MTAPPFRRHLLAALAAIAMGSPMATPARAHAELHHAEPADGAVLRASPPAIALMFSAPLRVTSLRLLDEQGRERRLAREGAAGAASSDVRAAVPDALPPGAYRVEWRGASTDGHVGGGRLSFRIERAAR